MKLQLIPTQRESIRLIKIKTPSRLRNGHKFYGTIGEYNIPQKTLTVNEEQFAYFLAKGAEISLRLKKLLWYTNTFQTDLKRAS